MAGVRTIERTRLLRPMGDQRVALLVAPGGFGKSTLADQFLDGWGLVAIRIRLRVETGDAELIDAFGRAARRAGLADLAQSVVADDPARAADEIVAASRARAEPFALLVDDVQLLTPSAWALLDGLVADLPPDCRTVICGRAVPGEVLEIRGAHRCDAGDLRMTASEVAEVVNPVVAGVTPTVLADVAAATDGWPAAVVIAAQRLRSDPTWTPSARSAGVRLLAGMLEPLLGADREAWVRLARLPLLDRTAAELVAGEGALDRLLRSALPSRSDHGRWTIIPDAVRDALLALAGDVELDLSTIAAVARHYAERGELPAALQVVGAATVTSPGNGDAASDEAAGRSRVLADLLASRHWTDLEGLGLTQLAQLIDTIPDVVLRPHAALLVNAARAAEAHRPTLRSTWLERLHALAGVDPLVRRAGDAERARDLVRAVRLEEAIALGEQVVATAGADELMTLGRAKLAIAHANAFTSSDESYATAERRFEEAAELFGLAREHRHQAEALSRLGYNVLFHQGKPLESAAKMELAIALLPTGDRTRATVLTSYADVLDWLGRTVECDAAVAEAIEIGERLRDHGILGLAHWTRAWTLGRRGDVDGLRREMREVERLRPGWLDTGNGVEFWGSLADQFISLGDLEALAHCRRQAEELGARVGYPQAVRMMTARIDALSGDEAATRAALVTLAELDRSIGAANNTRWVRRLEAAVASVRLGDLEAGRVHAAAAIELCEQMGLPDLARRFELPLVQRLAPVWPTTADEATHDQTTITMLGTFVVRTGHQDVTPPPGQASTLLKLLVLRKAMTADALIDALWPDADVDTGRSRLRNTLNRLRSRSGDLVRRRGETIEIAPDVHADVDVFERAAAESLAADAPMRVGLGRQAIALYTGELLPGDAFEDWAAAPRERLLRRYLALIDLVSSAAEAEGNHDEAARLLDLGIAADALDERRYVRLAELLVEQGRSTAARQVAERGLAVFSELGVPPSADLLRLRG